MRGKDSNQRPPGYEPDELPAALPRDIALFLRALLDYHKARGKSRTFFARSQIFSRDRNADDHQRRKCFAVKPGITGFPMAARCAGAFRRVNESAARQERGSDEKVSVGKADGRVYNTERKSCQACLIMIIGWRKTKSFSPPSFAAQQNSKAVLPFTHYDRQRRGE